MEILAPLLPDTANGRILKEWNLAYDADSKGAFLFDRGPVTLPGSLATPHQGQIFESAGRQTTFAPSYRMVIDLAEDEIHTNMAGGPSDRRFSKWYVADLENWAKGRYKRLKIGSGPRHRPFK